MKNITKRILTSIGMLAILAAALWFGLLQYLAAAVATGMVAEVVVKYTTYRKQQIITSSLRGASATKQSNKKFFIGLLRFARNDAVRVLYFILFALYSVLFIASAWHVSAHLEIILGLLLIIATTDIGAWTFGKLIEGDKLWPSVTAGKTWSGYIAGQICGAFAGGALIGYYTNQTFIIGAMLGLAVAVVANYGDLTESALKRKLGVKDMSNLLPGHGGLSDRFDSWIFVLPIAWLATLVM